MTAPAPAPLPPLCYEGILQTALAEDMGRSGDISGALLPAGKQATLHVVTREAGCIAGLEMSLRAFTLYDPAVQVKALVADGDVVAAGTVLATVSGAARSLLAAERTCLNLLGHLCGIATQTHALAHLIADLPAKLVDTRKTLPGLRTLQKYAVRAGGGHNHRFALDDAVMLKDNHVALLGDIPAAVAHARAAVGPMVKIEVEVDTLEQLDEVLKTDADVVMLDNMPPEMLKAAVGRVGGRMLTEASGGITAATIRAVAESGVDVISVGALTHSVKQLDIGLDYRQ
ncbi:MAG: carboxylating nicotinate-nucleotide diphosphorylase [Proteobacteria bacterium]|nr:carboxylating nicotinate-nucleotide diphosphorylase [Pseudomonadota bacterium]